MTIAVQPTRPATARAHDSIDGGAPAAQAFITLDDRERQRCEVWTRVMGYHRPVSSFNERRYFEERRCGEPAR